MWFVCTMCVKLCRRWLCGRRCDQRGSEPQRPSQGRVSLLHGAAAMLCQAGIFHPHASREASPFMLYGPLKKCGGALQALECVIHLRNTRALPPFVEPGHCAVK